MADSLANRAATRPPPLNPIFPSSRSPFSMSGATSPPASTTSFRSNIFTSPSAYSGNAEQPEDERNQSVRPPLPHSTTDTRPLIFDFRPSPAIVIRRLPRNISTDALRSMLIFAGDLIDIELIRSPYPEDQGFATAVARFETLAGANDAQQKLHGKPNSTKEANLIVEPHGSSLGGYERRSTIDASSMRGLPGSAATMVSGSSGTNLPPGRSRFGSTFQSTSATSGEKTSPPLPTPTSASNGEFLMPENNAHLQSLFSPQSPLGNGIDDHYRGSGKMMINGDSADDETGELLRDPVAYARHGPHQQQQQQHPSSNARHPSIPQLPTMRFANLSLNTSNHLHSNSNGFTSPLQNGLTSPRSSISASAASTLLTPLSPSALNGGPLSAPLTSSSYLPGYPNRPQYPPVNPADQNPPCNTLYVGNLPIDTSEDELKSVFSKQRGYKRLCFRTKQNGPMCFVEFEDISFATKALHELYGHPLHNSIKGGIRLSFSKNPLGVRSSHTTPSSGLSPTALGPGMLPPGYGFPGSAINYIPGANPSSAHHAHPSNFPAGPNLTPSFTTASGPPPGLASPPGLYTAGGYRSPPPPHAHHPGPPPSSSSSAASTSDSAYPTPFSPMQPSAPQQQFPPGFNVLPSRSSMPPASSLHPASYGGPHQQQPPTLLRNNNMLPGFPGGPPPVLAPPDHAPPSMR